VAIPLEKSTVGPPWKNSFRRSCSVGLFTSKNPNGFQQLRGSVGSTPTTGKPTLQTHRNSFK